MGWASIAQQIDRLNTATGRVVANAGLLMALITTGIVVMRYGFGQGSIGAQESVLYLHATLFMLGAAPSLLADKHVRVDVFYRAMSERRQTWVNTIGHTAFTLPFCALIFFGSYDYVAESWHILEGSPDPGGIPAVFLLKTLMPLLAVLLALQAISQIIKGLIVLSEAPDNG